MEYITPDNYKINTDEKKNLSGLSNFFIFEPLSNGCINTSI